ncbi:MAG: 30S ribosomal protein S18 [Candidatus Pacebacteria bacterium]|nr:30S ribosomal protein S18 [Candidatus Paceibacterota bacterium]
MKQCHFSKNNINYIDYKEVDSLRKFINPHGRMVARKRSGLCAKHQKQLTEAIKRARFMGLLPYVVR